MQPITLTPSPDGTALDLALGEASAELSATDVDRLIHDLAAARAKMTPIHPAEPPTIRQGCIRATICSGA